MLRMELLKSASLLVGLVMVASGQTFNSGSSGSDGALNLTTPGTIVFDPKSFTPPLDPDGDGIYHFTTINIGTGVTVVFSGRNLNGPLYWLASGAVQIDGVMHLRGETGHPGGYALPNRYPAYPGPGGFFGGMGGRFGGTNDAPPQQGGGPGGGLAATTIGDAGNGGGGTHTGNQFAVPLIGGSGGGGGILRHSGGIGSGGGAGGGAVTIASSSSIRVNGAIDVRGSSPGDCVSCQGTGGGGAGGAIRLVANTISGTGLLDTRGASGSNGPVRLEAFQHSGPTNIPVNQTYASPSNLFLPSGATPSVRISSIAGIPTPASPTGSFTVPDIAINSAAAVPIVVEAKNIPVGTVVKLRLLSEQGADQILDTTPLAGTLALSTATASTTFPSGYSRSFVRATWTQ